MLEEILLAKFLNWNSRIHPVGQVKTAEPWVAAWQTSMSSTPNWTMYCNSWNRCSLNWPEGGWQFHSSELLVSIPSSITSDRATGKKEKNLHHNCTCLGPNMLAMLSFTVLFPLVDMTVDLLLRKGQWMNEAMFKQTAGRKDREHTNRSTNRLVQSGRLEVTCLSEWCTESFIQKVAGYVWVLVQQ